jgi:hypothetical protein
MQKQENNASEHNIIELIQMVEYYQRQADIARKAAKDNPAGSKIHTLMGPLAVRNVDPGEQFDRLAMGLQRMIDSYANIILEGKGKPQVKKTKIQNIKGEEIKASKIVDEENPEVTENEEIKEAIKTITDLVLEENEITEICELWNAHIPSERIKTEITEEDHNNPEIVIEVERVSHLVSHQVKRTLSSREKARNLYLLHMEQQGISTEDIKARTIDQKIAVMNNKHKSAKLKNEKLNSEEKLAALNVKVKRKINSILPMKAMETIETKIVEGFEFNIALLAGTFAKGKISEEDEIKLNAIRLAASGQFDAAVSLVYNFFNKNGMTVELSKMFVSKLMGADKYKEVEDLIVNIFKYHKFKDKDYTKGIEKAKNVLKAYTRRHKVDNKGNKITENIDGKDIPVFIYWSEKKIESFIQNCVNKAISLGIISTPKSETSEESSETMEEPVSSGQAESSSESNTDENISGEIKEKIPEVETKKKTTAANTTKAKSTSSGTETTEESIEEDIPTVVVKAKALDAKKRTGEVVGFPFKVITKAKDDTVFERAFSQKFRAELARIIKNNNNPANENLELPKGFENYKPGIKFKVIMQYPAK